VRGQGGERDLSARREQDPLHRDLRGDHRDSLVRVALFLAERGAPPAPGDTPAELAAHRGALLDWLAGRDDLDELAVAYQRYVRTWSPIYRE
jgi:hypothetical protein